MKITVGPSFDNFSKREQRCRDNDSKRFGGREINDEIECGGLLNWDFTGRSTAENL